MIAHHISKSGSKELNNNMVLEVKRIKLSMSLQGNHNLTKVVAEVFRVTKLGKFFKKPPLQPLLLIMEVLRDVP